MEHKRRNCNLILGLKGLIYIYSVANYDSKKAVEMSLFFTKGEYR